MYKIFKNKVNKSIILSPTKEYFQVIAKLKSRGKNKKETKHVVYEWYQWLSGGLIYHFIQESSFQDSISHFFL